MRGIVSSMEMVGSSAERVGGVVIANRGAGTGPVDYQPAYARIADDITASIGTGEYRPGSQLPGESELRARYAVSSLTVRRAINLLLDRGLVNTIQGKGTFVRAPRIEEALFRMEDDETGSAQEPMSVRLLEASIKKASSRVASKLGCEVGERVVFFRRLLLRDGEPLMYQRDNTVCDPHRPLLEAQLEITSLQGLLETGDSEGMGSAELHLRAVTLTDEEAGYLEQEPGAPALALEHLTWDYSGSPVNWGWFIIRADRFSLGATLGASPRSHDPRSA
jgi:DNA-binding GntR family transcriptional regulator